MLQEFAFELRVEVAAIEEMGQTAKGIRRVIPITGGTFEGPAIQGHIVAGGYDWQIGRSDGVTEVEARYLLRTHDGSLITIINQGLRHGPPEVMQRLAKGELVDPSDYYFRSIPVFETADPRYDWLTRSVFIATGIRQPSQVLIRVYRLL
ncbi:DUF3237 domain-containing protein [Spirosoma taeanense]|uniref:UPF0311 protein HNV11_08730 n=1 Tax=Spirosoma taeanense TaxID=2735870 RepID=A0A6M5YH81_9BACT|nr:DUF3237 domain-containing protein [Spirosoma taeanense]